MARLSLAILVVLLASSSPLLCAAQKAAAAAKPAAGPTAPAASGKKGDADAAPDSKIDINTVLKDDQFSEFRQLLHETRVDTQINAQLTDSYNGLTMVVPTNAAYDKMKAGSFNGLSPQEQIQMVLYCVMPRFYSLSMLGSLNGKVTTQGSGKEGTFKYDIERSGNNVNVSTGVNWMLLGTPVSKEFPLAVYPVDEVPLPYELYGPKAPTPAPAPAPAPSKSKTKKKKKGIAEPPTADDDTTSSDNQKTSAAPAGVAAAATRWVAALSVLAAAVLGLF